MILRPCLQCWGKGLLRTAEKIEIAIPARPRKGLKIFVQGKGSYSRKGIKPGDLQITFDFEDDPRFTFDAQNILCKVPRKSKTVKLLKSPSHLKHQSFLDRLKGFLKGF